MDEEETDEGRGMAAAVYSLFPGFAALSDSTYSMCDLPHTHFGRLPNPWFHTYNRKGLSSLEPHQTLLVSNFYVTTPTRPLMQSENETGQREEEKKKKPPIQEGR